MSLFESASLVVTPNGTKASKLYAIKPTSGAGDLSVTRATTATRVNSAGLIESVAVNVPRLDYTNSTCPSILVEPQRTNLLVRSQEFDNASWVKFNGATVTPNAIISPDGTANADQLIASPTQEIYNGGAKPLGSIAYTVSCFAKYNGSVLKLQLSDFATTLTEAQFNLQTGVVGTITQGATWSNTTSSIQNYGNGWYRCILTSTSPVTAFIYNSIIGNAYIYGSQLEAGSYPTSYIPTTSASVTRNADVISKTGISSLIGQTEGTVFVDYFEKNGLGIIPLRINGSDGKFIWIRGTGAMFFGNSSALLFNNFGTPTANQRYKIAFVYGQNDFRLFVNGSFVSSVTTGTFTGTFSDVQLPALPNEDPFGQQYFVNSLQLYKTKLTNSELATLTTI